MVMLLVFARICSLPSGISATGYLQEAHTRLRCSPRASVAEAVFLSMSTYYIQLIMSCSAGVFQCIRIEGAFKTLNGGTNCLQKIQTGGI
jgi:hypothetical protein